MDEPISHRRIPWMIGDSGYGGVHIEEQSACDEPLRHIPVRGESF
jgi:hypothetical protein